MGFRPACRVWGRERGRDQEIAEIGFWGLLQRPCRAVQALESVTEALGTNGVRDDGMGGRDDRAAAYRFCCTAALLPALLPTGARQGCPTPCAPHIGIRQHRSFQVPSSVVRFLLGSCLPKNFIPAGPSSHAWPAWPACLPLPSSVLDHPGESVTSAFHQRHSTPQITRPKQRLAV